LSVVVSHPEGKIAQLQQGDKFKKKSLRGIQEEERESRKTDAKCGWTILNKMYKLWV
jgi:hypothetical protein